jgi:beta-phosphoglucomutase-like phosphatase (HAD superfamily)
MSCEAAVTINRRDFDATIFDLDGVLTDTARVHAAAWKRVFDDVLQRRADRQGIDFQPFDIEADYLSYVDGRTRYDGARAFLAARGLELPEGSEHDPENAETVHAIAERKTRLFRRELEQGIDPAPGAPALLARLRQAGIGIAVASSSENCAPFSTLHELITLSTRVWTASMLPSSGCRASQIQRLFWKPPAASGLRLFALSCSRTPWLASKLAGAAPLDGWSVSTAAVTPRRCASMGLMSWLQACCRWRSRISSRGWALILASPRFPM